MRKDILPKEAPHDLLLTHFLKKMEEAGSPSSLFVAFSGGLDSSVLFFLAKRYADLNQIPLTAIHVHHGIRKEEADRDLTFCISVAKDYGIPLQVYRYDIPTLSKEQRESEETVARKARYAAFQDALAGETSPCLLLAHHADDNLETVLFRLLRGSGLSGLCGIPKKRGFANGILFRPLLDETRNTLLAFSTAFRIPHIEDSTNDDLSYTRNRIRHTLVPAAREILPGPEHAISRMVALLEKDRAYLDSVAEEAYQRALTDEGLLRSELLSLPEPIALRVLLLYYKECFGREEGYTSSYIEGLYRLLSSPPHTSLSLPQGRARITKTHLKVMRGEEKKPIGFSHPIHLGETELPECGMKAVLSPLPETDSILISNSGTRNKEIIYNSETQIRLCFDTIRGSLYLRSRRPGDRILSGGIHKSLRTLLNAAKVPLEVRASLPLLAYRQEDSEEILWVPGIASSDLLTSLSGDSYLLTLIAKPGRPESAPSPQAELHFPFQKEVYL